MVLKILQNKKLLLLPLFMLMLQWKAQAQSHPDVVKSVFLDSVVVAEVKRGFSVEDFIEIVKNDTSFFYAFQNLRFVNYDSNNEITIYNRKKKPAAGMKNFTRQTFNNNCRWMETFSENVSGNFYNKKGEHNYYTADLFAYLFFTKDTVCNHKRGKAAVVDPDKKLEHAEMLKMLIFNPGSNIKGVPLIGNKLAIFEPEIAKYYNFKISTATYRDSISCYIFSVEKKENVSRDKVVINTMSTWFNRKDFNVVARNYNLSYSTILFDFDVQVDAELIKVGEEYYPQKLKYSGFWDVPLRKPEIADFDVRFSGFR